MRTRTGDEEVSRAQGWYWGRLASLIVAAGSVAAIASLAATGAAVVYLIIAGVSALFGTVSAFVAHNNLQQSSVQRVDIIDQGLPQKLPPVTPPRPTTRGPSEVLTPLSSHSEKLTPEPQKLTAGSEQVTPPPRAPSEVVTPQKPRITSEAPTTPRIRTADQPAPVTPPPPSREEMVKRFADMANLREELKRESTGAWKVDQDKLKDAPPPPLFTEQEIKLASQQVIAQIEQQEEELLLKTPQQLHEPAKQTSLLLLLDNLFDLLEQKNSKSRSLETLARLIAQSQANGKRVHSAVLKRHSALLAEIGTLFTKIADLERQLQEIPCNPQEYQQRKQYFRNQQLAKQLEVLKKRRETDSSAPVEPAKELNMDDEEKSRQRQMGTEELRALLSLHYDPVLDHSASSPPPKPKTQPLSPRNLTEAAQFNNKLALLDLSFEKPPATVRKPTAAGGEALSSTDKKPVLTQAEHPREREGSETLSPPKSPQASTSLQETADSGADTRSTVRRRIDLTPKNGKPQIAGSEVLSPVATSESTSETQLATSRSGKSTSKVQTLLKTTSSKGSSGEQASKKSDGQVVEHPVNPAAKPVRVATLLSVVCSPTKAKLPHCESSPDKNKREGEGHRIDRIVRS